MCQLACGLYGLRQSGHVWYQMLTKAFKDLGFALCTVDHTVFISHNESGRVVVAASTDNLLIISDSLNRETKHRLETHFEMTDLGEVRWLLGMEIHHNHAKRTLSLSQGAFVKTIVRRFNLEDVNTVTMPMDPSMKLSKEQCPKTDEEKEDMADVPYRELVGSLMYTSVTTQPDIAHAITTLSQFLENLGRTHWQAGLRVLRYLKGTADYALTYGFEDGVGMPEGKPVGYTDADFASQEHRHLVSGYAFLMHGGAISWSSKMQAVIALSSTEAEYIAGTHTAKEAKWLTMLLSEIGVEPPRPFPVLTNNMSAIVLSKDNAFHSQTKHINIPYHYIHKAIEVSDLRLDYVKTDENLADVFMKALARPKVELFLHMLGLSHLPSCDVWLHVCPDVGEAQWISGKDRL